MLSKRLSFEEFKYIYSKVPRLCVDLVVKKDNELVLIKRDIPPYKGYWHLPGGTVLLHEQLKDTVQRVAKDEIGSSVKIIKLLGTMEFPPDEVTKHTVSVVYLVKPLKDNLKGGWQGKELNFFKKLPDKTIKIHADFLLSQKLINK